jgi:hypothetical protein
MVFLITVYALVSNHPATMREGEIVCIRRGQSSEEETKHSNLETGRKKRNTMTRVRT